MGINSADHQEDGCGNLLLWIIGVPVGIFLIATLISIIGGLFSLIWSAIQFVLGLLAALALLCLFGFVIQQALYFFWFIIGIFI